MAWVALLLGLLALLLLGVAWRLRQQSGLPWARIAFDDSGARRAVERPLFARAYGLTGRPDYLLEQGGALIPVEVKPTRRANRPYESDLFQLIAYCLLVEETSGRAPPYGILRYAEQSFRIEYTPALRAELLAILAEMRDLLASDDQAERNHDEPARCAGCGFLAICDETLVEASSPK